MQKQSNFPNLKGSIIWEYGSSRSEKMLDYKIKHQNYIISLWCFMLSLMERKTSIRISGEMLHVLNNYIS